MSSRSTKAGLGVAGIIAVIAAILFSISHKAPPTPLKQSLHLKAEQEQAQPTPTQPIVAQPPQTTKHSITVRSGDTLASIFYKLHLSSETLEDITATKLAASHLDNLHPGQQLTFYIDHKHHLQQLVADLDHASTLYISSGSTGYAANIKSKPVTIALEYKSGRVNHSLQEAAMEAGLTTTLYHDMKNIFQGSIDFQHNIHRGDHFSLLFQEYYVDGKKDHPGNIMAAEFTNNNKKHTAIRYTYPKNHTGYYTPDGHGVEPLFLSKPVKHYKRISSFFTYHRMDPYLHVMRPHLGIDYAAPRGTPIRSVGNGRVIFAGRDHGYGNAIVIRYNKKYKTLYGHMEHFAKGIHSGVHVKRGQTIGFIGSTGWSTGPHLHFEMYVYGIPKDPLKLKFPGGKSIPTSYTKNYAAYAHKMLNRLKLYQGLELAQNETAKIKK